MRVGTSSKYDAQNSVLNTAYGALADLRRELADSKAAVAERTELLRQEMSILSRSADRAFTEDADRRLAGVSDRQGVGGAKQSS